MSFWPEEAPKAESPEPETVASKFMDLAAFNSPSAAANYLGNQEMNVGHKAMMLILAKLAAK